VGTVRTLPSYYSPISFEKITVSTSSIPFTTIPSTPICRAVMVTVETDQVRFRVDGSAPDSTTGHLLNVGDILMLENVTMIANFRVIRVTTDATIQVSYFGGGV